MKNAWLIPAMVAMGIGATLPSVAAPEAPPAARTWQLDFEFFDPQRIILRLPGDTHKTTFWYLLYRVTNNTGRDVEFYPAFSVVTNRLQAVEGGSEISPSVYDGIASRHKKEYPFFARPSKITGLLLQGADSARTSAAVFRAFDPEVDRFTLYVSGLSGDVERVINPGFNADKPETEANPRSFVMRRTLAVTYDLPGDAKTRHASLPIRRTRSWVMR